MERIRRNWWAIAIRGIAAIVFGILAFLTPGATMAVLLWLFAGYALVDGVFSVIAALRGDVPGNRWGVLLAEGIVGILAAVVTFIWPAAVALGLVYMIAAWALITGLLEIMAAVRLRRHIEGEWMLMLAGVLSIFLALSLFLAPGPGTLAVIWVIGAYAIVFGAALLSLAFRLRHYGHLPGGVWRTV